MADYRRRMREAGLRPVQIWLPDTRAPDFIEMCRKQSEAVARHDPAGNELMEFIARLNDGMDDWPAD
jgi:hypothetical protein